MPVHGKKVRETIRTVRFQFLGETANIDYRLASVASDFSDWMSDHGTDKDSLRQAICRIVTKWDYLDEKDQPLPITVKAIVENEVPTSFLRAVLDNILEDAQPGKLVNAT